MRRIPKVHRILLLWLGVGLAFLCLFWLTRGNRSWMNALASHVTGPLKRAVGRVCYLVPFSVMEALIVALALAAAVFLAALVAGLARSPHKRRFLSGALLLLLCAALTIYDGFCLLWGVNYYTDSFQDRSGLYAQPVAAEDLYRVTDYFVQRLQETAGAAERDGDGVFCVPRDAIFAKSATAYQNLSLQFPFLAFPDETPKRVHFSRVMSAMNFTGVFCPFTGDSNLHVDSPACLLPATIAHELAHQRGVASEQECNFLAVLASTTCGDPVYAYSGWLMGYIHLGNAVYRADPDRWQTVWDALPPEAQFDIRYNNAYWKQFESPASHASQAVYDSFLKGYGQELGIQTYGTVVDLLVAYYKDLV